MNNMNKFFVAFFAVFAFEMNVQCADNQLPAKTVVLNLDYPRSQKEQVLFERLLELVAQIQVERANKLADEIDALVVEKRSMRKEKSEEIEYIVEIDAHVIEKENNAVGKKESEGFACSIQ